MRALVDNLITLVVDGCTHPNTTWPRHDADGGYVRCNDCGKRISDDTFDEKEITK